MLPIFRPERDIRRVTLPLPLPPGEVHCYLVRGATGWTAVDTGLGTPELEGLWRAALDSLDGPVERIVITHFHPDHAGGGEVLRGLTGAQVLQGELDHRQSLAAWGSPDWPLVLAAWFRRHGVPAETADELLAQGELTKPLLRFARDVRPIREGDRIEDWTVVELPGHADGHVCLLRDGVMLAGDHLLATITPAVGLYPDASPDPLGDYLTSLRRTVSLAPRLALTGHGPPVRDPVARALELIEHHRRRLDATREALDAQPRNGYEVSLALFPEQLTATGRRFAVAETLAHLERLVREGRAARAGDGPVVAYTGRRTLVDDEIPRRRPQEGR